MLPFTETRLPLRLAFGSTGGVERRTEIIALASGYEQRASPWADGRRRYLIGGGLKTLDDMAALMAFFEARRGRLQGFRFQDFLDPASCAPSHTPGPLDQAIGVGDGAARLFQLTKTYGTGPDAYVRRIQKPVAGTVSLAVAGVVLTSGQFSVDAATGLVTLMATPAAGVPITAGFQFDVPVRFDADRLDVSLEGFAAARLTAVPLIELRL